MCVNQLIGWKRVIPRDRSRRRYARKRFVRVNKQFQVSSHVRRQGKSRSIYSRFPIVSVGLVRRHFEASSAAFVLEVVREVRKSAAVWEIAVKGEFFVL